MKKLLIYIFFIPLYGVSQDLYHVSLSSFNTPHFNEFSPFIIPDQGLIIISNRNNDFITHYRTINDESLFDIYFISWQDTSKPYNTLFAKELRTVFHEGPACLSPDGNTLYFTCNQKTEKRIGSSIKGSNRLGIFFASRLGNGWTEPAAFRYNDPMFNTAHPALNKKGDTLFFSSDKPGGTGGLDLYFSVRKDTGWSAPTNLGAIVNSASNDMYPFVTTSGKLYFTSNRPGGQGKMDIYYTRQDAGTWMLPVNLGPPINSRSDDFSFTTRADEKTGYFASNRRNKQDDIYTFEYIMPIFDCKPQQNNSYCYTFFEENLGESDTVTMQYEWNFGDGEKQRGKTARHCYKEGGSYMVRLNAVDPLTGEIYYNQAEYEIITEDIEQPFISFNEPAIAGDTLLFSSSKTYLKDIRIEKVYWIFDDDIVIQGREAMRSYRRPGTRRISLGITGVHNQTGEPFKQCSFIDVEVIKNKK